MFTTKYFGKYYISDYITQKRKQIKSFVDNLDDSYFESYDNDSLLEFIREKTKINLVEIHDLENPKIEMSQKTEKEERYNHFRASFEPKTFMVDVDNIYWYISIRLTGDMELLDVQPNNCVISMGSNYDNINISPVRNQPYHVLTVTIKKTLDETKSMTDLTTKIYEEFQSSIKFLVKNLETLNKQLQEYSASFDSIITDLIIKRCEKIDTTKSLFDQFKIPLKETESITFSTPLVLKKKDIVLPLPQKQEQSYHIETKDINKINGLIYSFCSTLERTPRTYENNGEEDIRNMILAMLNTQYSNATGETFSNKGKTDIYIGHYNKAAYIAECKLWKGERVLLEAIDQLLGYTTWKDCAGTLLFFNKQNKNFRSILEKVPENLKKHSSFTRIVNSDKNIFEFEIYKNTEKNIMPIKLMLFDLHC